MSNQTYSLRRVTEDDYDFIYQVKKDAYKKYVEQCFGSWDEEQQRAYFRKFIETYKEGAFIISFDGKEIGFYNGCATERAFAHLISGNRTGHRFRPGKRTVASARRESGGHGMYPRCNTQRHWHRHGVHEWRKHRRLGHTGIHHQQVQEREHRPRAAVPRPLRHRQLLLPVP